MQAPPSWIACNVPATAGPNPSGVTKEGMSTWYSAPIAIVEVVERGEVVH